MSQRKAVTRATATRYRSASKGSKAVILDELCQLTGWHRDHARKRFVALWARGGWSHLESVERQPMART